MIESPDGNFLVITNNGYAKPTLTVVDLRKGLVSSKASLEHAWLGLAWHPDGRRVFSSGAGQTTVNEFCWTPGRLTAGAMYALGRDTQKPMPGINRPEPVEQSFVGGIAVSPDGRYVYAVHVLGEALTMLDVKSGLVRGTVDVGAGPYTCVVSPDGTLVVVSVWDGAKVLMFDAATLEKLKVFTDYFFLWSQPDDVDYENVHIEVTVKNNGTDATTAFGIICNQQVIDDSFYYFAVTPAGEYAIAKASLAQTDVFLTNNDEWGDSDLIAENADSYRLGADCGNGTLTLYVDGQQIASVSDATYTNGGVALLLWSAEDVAAVDVTYDDFVMTKLK